MMMKNTLWIGLTVIAHMAAAQPIRLHPENPHYFLFDGRPTVLITSAEHYGAVLNPDFDYRTYLDVLAADGLNYTRLFTGSYFEPQGAFGIAKNTMAPAGSRVLVPWARSEMPGYRGGGNRFDLTKWDEAYFARLRDFVRLAGEKGIIVEVTLFSSIYGDQQWSINPFNPANNVNATDSLQLRQVNTLSNGNIWSFQEQMVRKVVRELNEFDNVIYEIQNEPWADNHTIAGPINKYMPNWPQEWMNRVEYPSREAFAWQRKVAEVIQNVEAALPSKHLIAQNFVNFRYPLIEVDSVISIINFHYAYPEAVTLNYGWDRALGLDETGFAGSADSTYRRQAWTFMLSGGALFNNLDYSFTVDRPDGTDTNRAPGGGSPALRRQLGFLKRFMDDLEFVRMRPDRSVVIKAPGAFREALVDPGRAYAVFLEGALTGDLVLELPEGSYQAAWFDPETGQTLGENRLTHDGGRLHLKAPSAKRELALKVTRTS